MSWTQAELDALKSAYASGTLRVSYEGKTVEYAGAIDLLSRIRTIERGMAANTRARRPVAGLAGFSRGER